MLNIQRHPNNPILRPNPDIPWMSKATMNAGLWHDESGFHMVFSGGGLGEAYCGDMRLGYAYSSDGLNFDVRPEPLLAPDPDGWDSGGCLDARVMKYGEDYFIVYNAGGKHPYRRVGLAKTRDFKTVERIAPLTDPEISDANVIFFPRKINGAYVMMHRPSPFQPSTKAIAENPDFKFTIKMARSDDMINWTDDRDLCGCEQWWENQKIGPCCEPIETEEGWLMLYHGVYLGDDVHIRTYRIGAMLLDLDDPYKVIARTPEPIMSPETDYEKFGNHDNVIFPCATPVIDGVMHIYYGAADTCIGLATVPVVELLAHVLEHRLPG